MKTNSNQSRPFLSLLALRAVRRPENRLKHGFHKLPFVRAFTPRNLLRTPPPVRAA